MVFDFIYMLMLVDIENIKLTSGKNVGISFLLRVTQFKINFALFSEIFLIYIDDIDED